MVMVLAPGLSGPADVGVGAIGTGSIIGPTYLARATPVAASQAKLAVPTTSVPTLNCACSAGSVPARLPGESVVSKVATSLYCTVDGVTVKVEVVAAAVTAWSTVAWLVRKPSAGL